jgi:hypothetical protein
VKEYGRFQVTYSTYKSSLGLNIRSNDYQIKHARKKAGLLL